MKRYVIIGGGVASVGCIEGIRSVDKTSEIVLVAKEGVPVYCRPLISYYLEGKTDLERMKYRPDDFYDKMGCRLLYGTANPSTRSAKPWRWTGKLLPTTSCAWPPDPPPLCRPLRGWTPCPSKRAL